MYKSLFYVGAGFSDSTRSIKLTTFSMEFGHIGFPCETERLGWCQISQDSSVTQFDDEAHLSRPVPPWWQSIYCSTAHTDSWVVSWHEFLLLLQILMAAINRWTLIICVWMCLVCFLCAVTRTSHFYRLKWYIFQKRDQLVDNKKENLWLQLCLAHQQFPLVHCRWSGFKGIDLLLCTHSHD